MDLFENLQTVLWFFEFIEGMKEYLTKLVIEKQIKS